MRELAAAAAAATNTSGVELATLHYMLTEGLCLGAVSSPAVC